MNPCDSDTLHIEAWRPWTGTMAIHKGETFDPNLEWTDDAGPIDWTGYAFVTTIEPNGDAAAFDMSTANGKMVVDNAGNMQWLLTHLETAALTFATGKFEVFMTEPGGNMRLFGYGEVAVD